MTLKVGDLVEYKTSKKNIEQGIITGDFGGCYWIYILKGRTRPNVNQGDRYYINRWAKVDETYWEDEDQSFAGNRRMRTKVPLYWVGNEARNIRKLEFNYDPNQQKDEEDDI